MVDGPDFEIAGTKTGVKYWFAKNAGIVKLTYNIAQNHRLMHGYHNDYWSFPGVPNALQAPSTVNLGHGDNPTPNLV